MATNAMIELAEQATSHFKNGYYDDESSLPHGSTKLPPHIYVICNSVSYSNCKTISTAMIALRISDYYVGRRTCTSNLRQPLEGFAFGDDTNH